MEVINEMDYFTPSSLYTHQFPVVRLNKPALAVAIQTLYDAGRIQQHEEKKAGNTVYQTYTSTERDSGEETIYSFIRDNGPCTKSSVAKGTGLSRFTSDKRIEQMVKEKSIRRIGERYAIAD
jgi:predicted HTH transcriptional regulator